MARTKASVGAKVAAVKSSKARCSVAPPPTPGPSGTSDRSSRNYSGGNSVCPRETPKWQKPITRFFISKDNGSKDSDYDSDGSESNTKQKPKRNVIQSDDEDTEPPKNKELDETIELEPLIGENSHKIDEYYTKNNENGNHEENNNAEVKVNGNGEVKAAKGKGVGKKTKGKENLSDNVDRKRERDEKEDLVEENNSKRIKVDV